MKKTAYILLEAIILGIAVFVFLNMKSAYCDSIPERDSLFNIMGKTEGPEKVRTLIKLINILEYDEPDSANYFGLKALGLARSIKGGELEVDAINALAELKKNNCKYDSALYYYDLGIQTCKKNGLEANIASFYYKKGAIHDQISSYDSALFFDRIATQLASERNDTAILINAQVDIGYLYFFWGNNDSALYYLDNALLLAEKSDYKTGTGRISVALGNMYYGWKNFDKAIEYYKKAYGIAEQINSKSGMGVALSNIGAAYTDMENYQSAIKYLKMSLPVLSEVNEEDVLANSYLSLVKCYVDAGIFDTAKFYIDKGLQILKKQKNKESLAVAYNTYGQLYSKWGDFNKSIGYTLKSLSIAKSVGFKPMIKICYKQLAINYEKANQLKPSIRFWVKYDSIKDSLDSQQTLKNMAGFEAKYKNEKQKKEIALLEKDNEIKELDIKKKRWQRNTTLAGLVIIVIFVFALYNRFRLNKNTTKLLSEKNDQISKQNNSLEELNKKQQELIATKDKFFSIIAHDLKSPFTLIQGISDLFYNDFGNLTGEEKKKFIQSISQSANNTFKLLENLLEWSYSQSGNLKIEPEKFNVDKVIDGTIQILKPQAERKQITIEFKAGLDTKVFADINMARTIIRNLISNAIKFSNPGGEIVVTVRAKRAFAEIVVTDQGVGIDKTDLDKLFRIDNKVQTKGTANEKGTGLGLILCHEFVTKNGGVISVESERGKGSRFSFSLPVPKAPI